MEDPARRICLDCRYPLIGLRDTRCPECGRLFDPSDPATYSQNGDGLVKLFIGDSASDTHLLKDILMDAGIKAVVLGDALDIANGLLPLSMGMLPAVWVGRIDVEVASPIVEEFAKSRQKIPEISGVDWTCHTCEESIERQFSTCWNCGADRQDPAV